MDSRAVVATFLAAVESRDPAAVAGCFAPDASYTNMPHPPAAGREAIEAMFTPILSRSERIVWDIVSEAYEDRRAWLERVDRFWINGVEYRIECNGIAEIDPDAGLITGFRDYVDLGVWRERLSAGR